MKKQEKQIEEKTKGNRCSKCGSTLTYIKLKSKERVCRQCGFIRVVKGEIK